MQDSQPRDKLIDINRIFKTPPQKTIKKRTKSTSKINSQIPNEDYLELLELREKNRILLIDNDNMRKNNSRILSDYVKVRDSYNNLVCKFEDAVMRECASTMNRLKHLENEVENKNIKINHLNQAVTFLVPKKDKYPNKKTTTTPEEEDIDGKPWVFIPEKSPAEIARDKENKEQLAIYSAIRVAHEKTLNARTILNNDPDWVTSLLSEYTCSDPNNRF